METLPGRMDCSVNPSRFKHTHTCTATGKRGNFIREETRKCCSCMIFFICCMSPCVFVFSERKQMVQKVEQFSLLLGFTNICSHRSLNTHILQQKCPSFSLFYFPKSIYCGTILAVVDLVSSIFCIMTP